MNHPLSCKCGILRGIVAHPERVNRAICYCRDCQAFARFLGRAGDVLDSSGGTDVIQTIPAHLTFTQGQQQLACMRLTEKGLVRWYSRCCNTPIGNTSADFRVSFIGLIHNCLESHEKSLDDSFGPVRMWSFTKGAKKPVKSRTPTMIAGILRLIGMVIRARVSGAYKQTPLFSPDTGAPVAVPKILSSSERAAVYRNV
jgi:hypothetical protein